MTSDTVRFNVGGTVFETTRSTIDKLNSDYFSRLLDPTSGFSQPTDGIYFIDRDPDCFRVILNIARYDEVFLNSHNVSIEMVEREAEYYLVGEDCRALISRFKKNEIFNAKFASLSSGQRGTGLFICMDLSAEDFASKKGQFFRHHTSLKKERQYQFSGGLGYDLTCTIDQNCPETTVRPRDLLACCRCGREIDLSSTKSEFNDWCHRCRRCLRCTETLCVILEK